MTTRKSFATAQATARAFMAEAPHRVGMVIFPEASSYDITGAAEVLSTANNQSRRDFGFNADAYVLEIISSVPGPVTLEMGLRFIPDSTIAEARTAQKKFDTLIVTGGNREPIDAAMLDKSLLAWIKQTSATARRVASMCTGAFLLAEAGVLTGP